MVKDKVQGILRILSFSRTEVDLPAWFRNGSIREWNSVMNWLDSSGLARYFPSALESSNMSAAVPPHVLCQLKQRQEQNRQRMNAMWHTFNVINREFFRAGVEYVVLKGFSLLPEYCLDESRRVQGDLDYLVAPDSLDKASRVLAEHGYVLKRRALQEWIFWIPSLEPTSNLEQYDVNAPCVIELHTALWEESRFPVPLELPTLTLGPAKKQQWKECSFPALQESQTFYHQVLHTFQHVIDGSRVRLCHFYELAYFMHQSVDLASLWHEVESMLGSEPKLRDIAGLVSAMASQVFPGPRPAVLTRWSQELSPAVRLWIRNYSRNWLIEGAGDTIRFFSSAKLVLLLRDQYMSAPQRRTLQLRSLLPIGGLWRIVKPRRVRVANSKRTWQKHSRVLSRLLYHLGSNLRYLCELPRWQLTKRYLAHSNSSDLVRRLLSNSSAEKTSGLQSNSSEK